MVVHSSFIMVHVYRKMCKSQKESSNQNILSKCNAKLWNQHTTECLKLCHEKFCKRLRKALSRHSHHHHMVNTSENWTEWKSSKELKWRFWIEMLLCCTHNTKTMSSVCFKNVIQLHVTWKSAKNRFVSGIDNK